MGAATLGLEAVVLLLALLGWYGLHRHVRLPGVVVLLGLAFLAVGCAFAVRFRAGLIAGLALQGLIVVAGVLLWPLFVLGLVFGIVWAGYLRLVTLASRER